MQEGYRDTVARWALVAIGAGLCLLAVGRLIVAPEPFVSTLVVSGVNIVLALALVAVGVWFARSVREEAFLLGVTRWSVTGGVVLCVLAVWAVVSSALRGLHYPMPYRNVLGGTTLGVFAGTVAGYYHETSKRQARQLAELRGKRLERLASLLSHDLRSPLGLARGHLRQARASEDPDGYLASVDDALDQVETIVDDTLLLVGRGQGADPVDIELRFFANYCWETVKVDAAELVVVDDGVFAADRQRAATLFQNLFANAIDHGGPDVTVTVGWLDGGFYVADDGPGIPPADREDVFEIGHGDPGRTGLGLTIVDEIALEHGWTVSVTESAAGGARVEITGVDLTRDAGAGSEHTPGSVAG